MSDPNPAPTGRLLSHFANRDRQQQSAGWSELWDADESQLWDRGMPSPALIDFLDSEGASRLTGTEDGRRPKALVPGCGRGYDVVMLALHGFDAFGLEVSPKAVETARDHAEKELAKPSAYSFADQDDKRLTGAAKGIVTFVCGDFFQNDWEAGCFSAGEPRGFDLIYDYTFLCALLPEMRKDWARRMKELLRPSGLLVCLEFPLYKDLTAPGPPWGLQGVHWNLLAEGGDGIVDQQTSTLATTGGQGSFKRILYIKPERSYEVGRGTDMLSVWTLKRES
ncbi:S-adenosyl-L-methionine-dependent methyltransferase [Canariomyces notabilis]|uniref:S-adenosyl-L-methionine-dependent methyltransferase n=1 Tax=Canariomyces notabilis TaxID=2074819 RepID=A0AAN6QFE9_9PEZI|nr:S-adenosyl-L-methionine-dependent methyltransferase [Canariomyces arenarius]